MTLGIYITRDYEHMSDVAADILLKGLGVFTIIRGKSIRLALPTGNSPEGLYKRMVQRQNEFDATRISIGNIDELILEPEQHHESYAASLEDRFRGLNPGFGKTKFIDTSRISASELEQEILAKPVGLEQIGYGKENGRAYLIRPICKTEGLMYLRDKVLKPHEYRINANEFAYAILGVGENRHIGLHESGIPFAPFSQRIFLVGLDETTRQNFVKDGYFSSIEETPKYGITLDAQFIASNSVNLVVLASSARKSNAIERALLEDMSCKTPLSVVQSYIHDEFRKAYLIVDEEAAKGILGGEQKLRDKGMQVQDYRQIWN